MPKLNLLAATRIKTLAGEIISLKGDGYFWNKSETPDEDMFFELTASGYTGPTPSLSWPDAENGCRTFTSGEGEWRVEYGDSYFFVYFIAVVRFVETSDEWQIGSTDTENSNFWDGRYRNIKNPWGNLNIDIEGSYISTEVYTPTETGISDSEWCIVELYQPIDSEHQFELRVNGEVLEPTMSPTFTGVVDRFFIRTTGTLDIAAIRAYPTFPASHEDIYNWAVSQIPVLAPSAFAEEDWDLLRNNGSASVTINSLPANGGSTITDVEYRVDEGSWTSSGGIVSFNIPSLTNGVEYDVELRAINSIGSSPESDTKQVTPATTPSAMSAGNWDISVSAVGQISVDIITPPASNGDAITGYEYELNASGTWTTGGSSDFNITGLTRGTTYAIRLRAINSVGSAAASDSKSGWTWGSCSMTTTALLLNVKGYTSGTRGSINQQPIPGLTFTRFDQPYNSNVTTIVFSGDQLATLNEKSMWLGSTEFKGSWSFNGTNTVMTSNPGVAITATTYTLTVRPMTPEIPATLTSGDWTATAGIDEINIVITTPPASNGAPITDYQYELGASGTWVSTGSSTTFSITGLTRGTTYAIRIRAVNSVGGAAASDSKSRTPPYQTDLTTSTYNAGGGNVLTGYSNGTGVAAFGTKVREPIPGQTFLCIWHNAANNQLVVAFSGDQVSALSGYSPYLDGVQIPGSWTYYPSGLPMGASTAIIVSGATAVPQPQSFSFEVK